MLGRSTRRVTMQFLRGAPKFAFRTTSILDKKISQILPDLIEGMKEAEVVEWHIKEGDEIMEFDPICDVMTDKSKAEITSKYSGKVTKLYFEESDMVPVNSVIMDIEVEGEGGEESAEAAESEQEREDPGLLQGAGHGAGEVPRASSGKVLATPAVRGLAKKHGIDIAEVTGTGAEGRILKGDVTNFIARTAQKEKPAVSETTPADPRAPQIQPPAEAKVHKLRGYQKAMVKSMTDALQIPHLTYSDEIVLDDLVDLRKRVKDANPDVKISYMPFFLKALSMAMSEYPVLNSQLSSCLTEYTELPHHNISVAVDTPNGLVVPNIKNCEKKSIIEIAQDLNHLAGLAKKMALTENELKGGTIGLSNIGSIGGTYMGPVIMTPQVCLVAIGKMQTVPRYHEVVGLDGQKRYEAKATSITSVSLAADHRIVDGGTIARFTNAWKHYIENPTLMLVNLR